MSENIDDSARHRYPKPSRRPSLKRPKQAIVIFGSTSLVGYHLLPALVSATIMMEDIEFVSLTLEPSLEQLTGEPKWSLDACSQAKVEWLKDASYRVVAVVDVAQWADEVPFRWFGQMTDVSQRLAACYWGRRRAEVLVEMSQGWGAKLLAMGHVSALGIPRDVSLDEPLFAASVYVSATHVAIETVPLLYAEMSLAYEATILAALNRGLVAATSVAPALIAPCDSKFVGRTGIRLVDGYNLLQRLHLQHRHAYFVDARDVCKSLAKLTISPFLTGRFLFSGHKTTLQELAVSLGLADDVDAATDGAVSSSDGRSLFPKAPLVCNRWQRLLEVRQKEVSTPLLEPLLWETTGWALDDQRAVTEVGFTKRSPNDTLRETRNFLHMRNSPVSSDPLKRSEPPK